MRPVPLVILALLLAILWSPLPLAFAEGHFAAHMTRHMGLVALAAPFLAAGAPALPAPPVLIAALIEFAVVWGWHLPTLHGASCDGGVPFLLEQAMFFGAGWAVWAGALRGNPLAGAGGLLVTSMHMTLLGALLILAPSDLYAAACARPPDVTAQQMGGMLMLGIGTPVYLAGGLWLIGRALTLTDPIAKGRTS